VRRLVLVESLAPSKRRKKKQKPPSPSSPAAFRCFENLFDADAADVVVDVVVVVDDDVNQNRECVHLSLEALEHRDVVTRENDLILGTPQRNAAILVVLDLWLSTCLMGVVMGPPWHTSSLSLSLSTPWVKIFNRVVVEKLVRRVTRYLDSWF